MRLRPSSAGSEPRGTVRGGRVHAGPDVQGQRGQTSLASASISFLLSPACGHAAVWLWQHVPTILRGSHCCGHRCATRTRIAIRWVSGNGHRNAGADASTVSHDVASADDGYVCRASISTVGETGRGVWLEKSAGQAGGLARRYSFKKYNERRLASAVLIDLSDILAGGIAMNSKLSRRALVKIAASSAVLPASARRLWSRRKPMRSESDTSRR